MKNDKSKPASSHLGDSSPLRAAIVGAIIVAVAVIAAFANSMAGKFIFDDVVMVTENARLDGSLGDAVRNVGVRPMLVITLWFDNFLFGRSDDAAWCYHILNISVHLCAALLLLGVVRRTLSLPQFSSMSEKSRNFIAVASAVVWAVHPIQTESVTYVIQRAEAMMGMFYLASLYCLARTFGSRRPILWYLGTLVFCCLGAMTKEAMIAAPIMLFLYDLIFISAAHRASGVQQAKKGIFRSVGRVFARGWIFYGALAAGMIAMIPRFSAKLSEAWRENIGMNTTTELQYLMTQTKSIVHYVALTFWPADLCLDYGGHPARNLSEVWPQAALVVALIVLTVIALWRRPALGYLGLFFFVNLAPRSSIIPRPDLIVEHRMYLPLAAMVVLFVLTVDAVAKLIAKKSPDRAGEEKLASTISITIVAAVCLSLTIRTIARNSDYADVIAMWRSNVAIVPENARANYNLGLAISRLGDKQQSQPGMTIQSYYNQMSESATYMQRAIDGGYQYDFVYNDLGVIYFKLGIMNGQMGRNDVAATFFARAEDCYQNSIRIKPYLATSYMNMGNLKGAMGNEKDAEKYFRLALERSPNIVEGLVNLGTILIGTGRLDEGISDLRKALELDPSHQRAANNLSVALRRKAESAPAQSPATVK